MLPLIKDKVSPRINKLSEKINKNIAISGIVLIASYYLFDKELLGPNQLIREADQSMLIFALISSWIIYYVTYLHDQLKGEQSKKKRTIEIVFFVGLIILSSTLIIGYDTILPMILPTIQKSNYKAELMVFLILAPIIEETTYRKLFYNQWARPKYGKIKGGALIGFIFVITHPVVSLGGFILYWIPTLMFFMVYDLGGIKASIIIHFLYNLVAIM